ncbi:MAG: amylo-alpha-1,6-glucosidase [Propionibacteriaceae bacterium]|nr:amylo-alpha-1,6-glucosidase [Propionibacteriaceae bacterium]
MSPHLQPLLHDLVTTFSAPTLVLSDRTGDITPSAEGPGAQGMLHADVRVLSELRVSVDGRSAEHIATDIGSTSARFTGLLRYLAAKVVGVPDPQLRVDRDRSVAPGVLLEELTISSLLAEDIVANVQVTIGSDFASIEEIKVGAGCEAVPFAADFAGERPEWRSSEVSVSLEAPGATISFPPDRLVLYASWPVTIPARGASTVAWTLRVSDTGGAVVAASTAPLAVDQIAARVAESMRGNPVLDTRLQPWLTRSLADLNSLRMATRKAPQDTFFAAGAPWYLTLFGRDSLWAARLLLPLDISHAAGTLRTLAQLNGTRTDPSNAESPGKIMHELRRGQFSFGATSLPPLYYGTIDATPLWICLLHDAWRAGMDADVVRDLLPTLQAALDWLSKYGDADSDGFLEYIDTTGHGLANQGWKDSGDSVRFADGSIAEGPVALCEVQGYAYEAARSGADLLEEFGLTGAQRYREWAVELSNRFRAEFWCGEGAERYPALALDGRKQRVDSVTSNIGHLIGTGILNAAEELTVARRLIRPDMDSGLGLRTMSSLNTGYSPLSYHCGSVWPHDTAIVIAGLAKAGLLEHAEGLIEGLLRASAAFDQRLPELWSGEGRPVPYPAACRPQAWSAAAAATVASVLRQQ